MDRVDRATTSAAGRERVGSATPGVDGASRAREDATVVTPATPGVDGASGSREDATVVTPATHAAPIDLKIVELAAKRHRVVTWHELRAIGVNDRAVRHRVATGRLYRSHPGVYLLEPPESTSRLALFAAAVAACGPGALISHHAAAELWGLLPPQRGDIDVTVLGRNPGKRDGVRIHRTQALQRRDIRTRQGLPTSAPARVILELAPRLDGEHLENLIATAGRELKVTETEIFAVLERYPAYPGAGRVRAVLRRAGGPSLTRSKAERLLLSLIRRAGLPAPATNVRTGRGELDFRWPAERLVVEVDGFEFHGDRASFERDRRRDAELVAGGWRVIRFTWRQLTEEPFMVIARIAQALAR